MTTPESLPVPRIEELALLKLGYDHYLDHEIPVPSRPGEVVTGRNFLDAYSSGSPHREATQQTLELLVDMDPSDQNYETVRTYVETFIKARFSKPALESDREP